ncbi:MAG TPA: redox-regulated ATPase YchF [Dissulfurispiraceae bacterium]|nr:redox-regulated ATPase YchF [Dissulfurispiraceae bacterium]
MKLGIIGLSNSGKTTIFNALTGQNIETTLYASVAGEPGYGVVKVPDSRVDSLAAVYTPKKTTYATVEYVDYLGLTKGDAAQNRKVFDLIKDVDAIVHVVRAFQDDTVMHPMQSVDAMRDLETLELELMFGDLEFVEKRLERIAEAAKKGKKPGEEEKKLLEKCRESLEKEIPLRNVEFTDEEMKTMRHMQFVSMKPEVVVLNIAEGMLNTGAAVQLQSRAEGYFADRGSANTTRVVTLCGKVEMDIAQMAADEAGAFFEDLGITEPALNKLIHVSYELLGFISFLTTGEDEVRAWTIRKGLAAQQAAGKIHSDIERGFIRAEVVGYDDFMAAGSTAAARDKGHYRLEGKTYEVRDGDIINFRFNV